MNPERVRVADKPFQGFLVFINLNPGLSLRSNPGLKLANAFGVIAFRQRLRPFNPTVHKLPREGSAVETQELYAVSQSDELVSLTPKTWLITPKAFANSSPGFECSDNPGKRTYKQNRTLKGFGNRRTLSGFCVC